MRSKGLAAAVAAISFVISPLVRADSGQIVATQNIGDVCNLKPVTHRKTIVYVDLASIKKGEQEWGLTILNKLELAPREFLTILGVNPSTFEVTEAFDSCYPTLTKAEVTAAESNRGVWDSLTKLGPEAQQRENIETFTTQLRSSLNKLVDAAGKLTIGQRRDILGAVAIDKNRFEDKRSFYRLIIYSNGDILEPEINGKEETQQAIRVLNGKYSTSFSGADVFVYGVDGEQRTLESKDEIFTSFFLNNWGFLRSFSPSLPPQQSGLVGPVVRMSGTFQGGGAQGSVKLVYTTGDGSELKQGWLNFAVGTKSLFVPFEGEVVCKNGSCSLRATCLDDVPIGSKAPYFRKGDSLELSGNADGELKGSIKPAAPEVFKTGQGDGPPLASEKPEKVDYTLALHSD